MANNGTLIENPDAVVQDTTANHLISDRNGFRVRNGADMLVEEWTGHYVMPREFEKRHAQDYVRARKYDSEGATTIRPRQTDRFIDGPATWNGSSWTQSTGGVPAVDPGDL